MDLAFVQSGMPFDTCQQPPVESFAEVLLRTGKLAEAETDGNEGFPTTEGKRGGSPPRRSVKEPRAWVHVKGKSCTRE